MDGSTMSKPSDRDSASLLLHLLIRPEADAGEDSRAALRLASHTALNLASEAGTEALWDLGRALPWLAIYLDWTQQDTAPEALANTIAGRRLVAHLPRTFVLETLERCAAQVKTSPIRRAPSAVAPEADPRTEGIARLARIDDALGELLDHEDAHLLDGLLADSTLLEAAMAIAAATGEASTPEARRLQDLLPLSSSPGAHAPLRILASIEAAHFESLPMEFSLLEERGRRFELSLADNMNRHGLLESVRAALAFGPSEFNERSTLGRSFFFQFSAFAEDPAIEGLTRALVEMRWRCFAHLRGELPLEGLSPWVDYLRDGCAELAESRGITLREAIHFAHYCLHLVNICDLASLPGLSLREPLRRALMDCEDELKEFALIGQREGLSDNQARLERYDRARWLSQGPRAYLVDRLARLSGGWRKGTRPGPIGAPPRLHDEFIAPVEQALDALLGQNRGLLEALATLLAHAELQGLSDLEHLEPGSLLDLLVLVAGAARDLPLVDISTPFVVDCSHLYTWCGSSPAKSDRLRLLRSLLDHYPTLSLLEGNTEPLQTGPGLVTETSNGRLVVRFDADPELEALLTLLNHTPGHRPDLREALSLRLEEMLFNSAPTKAKQTISATEQQAENRLLSR